MVERSNTNSLSGRAKLMTRIHIIPDVLNDSEGDFNRIAREMRALLNIPDTTQIVDASKISRRDHEQLLLSGFPFVGLGFARDLPPISDLPIAAHTGRAKHVLKNSKSGTTFHTLLSRP